MDLVPDEQTKGFQFSVRILLVGVGLFCVIIVAVRIFLWPLMLPFTSGYWENVSDNYALWQTWDMLSLYIDRNAGQVPARWQDLSEEYKITNNHYSTPDLSYLKDRVVINFVELNDAVSGEMRNEQSHAEPIFRLRKLSERGIGKLTDDEFELNQRLRRTLNALPKGWH